MTTPNTDQHAPIIRLQDVHKYYGEYHALRGISAEIGQGEFFSLLGPSGCGKTTLLRAIAGFEDISSGAILLSRQNMEGVPPNKRPTNMVFQSYAIFPHLSVAENVGFGLRKSGLDRAAKARAVGEALEMVGPSGYGARAAHAAEVAAQGGCRLGIELQAAAGFPAFGADHQDDHAVGARPARLLASGKGEGAGVVLVVEIRAGHRRLGLQAHAGRHGHGTVIGNAGGKLVLEGVELQEGAVLRADIRVVDIRHFDRAAFGKDQAVSN